MSDSMALYVALAIFTGALGAIHIPINGALGARIQSTTVATFTFYGVAFLIIAGVTLLTTDRESIPNWDAFRSGSIWCREPSAFWSSLRAPS